MAQIHSDTIQIATDRCRRLVDGPVATEMGGCSPPLWPSRADQLGRAGWRVGRLFHQLRPKERQHFGVEVVVERFPQFVRLTKEQVALIEDPEVLRHVLVKVSVAQSAEEARGHLLAVSEAKEAG